MYVSELNLEKLASEHIIILWNTMEGNLFENKKHSRFGFIAMLIWCITSSAAYVLTGALETRIEPSLLCFGIFFIALLFFTIYNVKHLAALYQKIISNIKTVLLVNITTFLCWYLTIYPLKYIEPAIVAAVILTSLPIFTLITALIMGYKKQISSRELIISLFLFVGIFFLALVVWERKSAINHFSSITMLSAFIACLGGAIALAINNVHTKKLSLNGFTPIDILSTRFFLMVVISFAIAHHEIRAQLDGSLWLKILVISTTLIIIPQTVFQYALRELEPITLSILSPLKPVMTFFFEFFNTQLTLTFWSLLGIAYLTSVSIIGTLWQYNKSVSKRYKQSIL